MLIAMRKGEPVSFFKKHYKFSLVEFLTFLICVVFLYCFIFSIELPAHIGIGFHIGLGVFGVSALLFALVVYGIKNKAVSKKWLAVPLTVFLFSMLAIWLIPDCPACDYGVPDGMAITFDAFLRRIFG